MSGVVIFSSAALCSSSDWNKSGEEVNFKKDNQKVISIKSMMSGVVTFSAPPLIQYQESIAFLQVALKE